MPVPPLAGPCFSLSQLLQYSLALLQAVLPVLQQQLAAHPTASAALARVAATEQQLWQVVSQLQGVGELVAQALAAGPQQQQCVQQAQQGVLQLGLLLVQLCSGLRGEDGAHAAALLHAHGAGFVADGCAYLAAAADGTSSAGALMQQLSAGLHHVRALLGGG